MMKTVLVLSLSGTLLAGILFLCRPLYRERLSRRWQYYIWLIVIARLLVPWSLEIRPAGENVQTAGGKISQTISRLIDQLDQQTGQKAEYFKNMGVGQPEDLSQKLENTAGQGGRAEKEPDAAGSAAEKEPDAAGSTVEKKPDAAGSTAEKEPDAAGSTAENQQNDGDSRAVKLQPEAADSSGQSGSQKQQTAAESRGSQDDAAGSGEQGQLEKSGSSVLGMAKNTGAKMIFILIEYLPVVWLAAAVLLMVRKITVYQSFVKYIRAGSSAVDDIQLLEQAGAVIELSGIKHGSRPVDICMNSLISSPLLIGILKPCIVLPASDYFLSESGFHYTVMHELCHYRRKDLIYKWLVQAAVCLHWFNPFVYLIEREVSRLCELSCDEAVIQRLDEQDRKEYGDTLLNAMVAGTYKNPAVSVSFKEGKELLKGRLDAIMNYKKKSKAAAAAAIALACMFAAGAASIGAYQPAAAVTAKQMDLPIICEGGSMYYIFAEGADASDMPSGGVTDGAIGIDYVSKDGYTSMGPFSKRKKLLKEMESECSYGIGHGMYTQQEYDAFLYAAHEIDRIGKTDTDQFPKLNKHSIKLTEGSTMPLQLKRVKETPVWSSGSSKIAAVGRDGKVTAKSAGKTKIYARAGNITYVCRVKVVKKAASKLDYEKDYAGCGITKKNGSYYYRGDRVRIFMDLKADESFVIFHYDQNGTIDVRLRRAEDGSILKIESIMPKEADDIREDLELKKAGAGSYAKIVRMTREEVPEKVKKALETCSRGQWYVISRNKKQYLYYNGLPADYAFQSELNEGSLKVSILDLGRKSGCYVLLAVKKNVPVSIYYNSRQVSYEEMTVL